MCRCIIKALLSHLTDVKLSAITGASAGGNLAIILSHMLVATLHAPENFQLKLVLPVVVSGVYFSTKHTT